MYAKLKGRCTLVSWTSLSVACIWASYSLSLLRTHEPRYDAKEVNGISIFLTHFFFGTSAGCAFPIDLHRLLVLLFLDLFGA